MSQDVTKSSRLAAGLASADPPAVMRDCAPQLADPDNEVARAAARAMWSTVRHAGRPGAESEREAVESELIALLQVEQSAALYREVLWMLSELGTSRAVPCLAALLRNESAREDARMALQRIPGDQSLAALQAALETVPAPFRINIAQSLRARGVEVPGLPCEKLKPVKPTTIASLPE